MNAAPRILALTTVMGALASTLACSEHAMSADNDELADTAERDDDAELTVRIDVLPTAQLDADGEFQVLPRTEGPFTLNGDLDAGTITLFRPAVLEGEVFGAFVTPFASGGQLPAVEQPVPARITLRKRNSVQSYVTSTDERGLFGTLLVPHDEYELLVVPDDPTVPMIVDHLLLGEQPPFQALYLDYGVPIWGRVTDAAGSPLVGVSVHARAHETRTADAVTDADGRYLLRVPADGSYDVVSTGRASGRDPSLTIAEVAVGEAGARVDFLYTDLSPIFRGGTVLTEDNRPLSGVRIRFVSKLLDGYPEGGARVAVETITPADGNFDVRLIAGTYQVEFWPPAGEAPASDQSPLLLAEYVVEGGTDIGPVVLPSFIPTVGFVIDPWDETVAHARVTCREDGFGRREWSTYTDEGGLYELLLPQTPMTCALTPPGDRRLDLAVTRIPVDPREDGSSELRFQRGVRITGVVEGPEQSEQSAVVEVRDGAGLLLGSTLTGPEGEFELRVATP